MQDKKLPIVLTPTEIVYLTDAINNGDIAQGLPEKDAYLALGRDALLLMGSVFLDAVKDDGLTIDSITIHITEEQAWLFRSKVSMGSLGLNNVPIGPKLLRKLYTVLLQFHNQKEVDDLFDNIVVEHDVQFNEEHSRALSQLNEETS